MGTIWQDLQYGWRMLVRSPGFAIVAILTLAIGIGANAAMFSVINTVLLRPLPFPDANRIVFVWGDGSKPRYQSRRSYAGRTARLARSEPECRRNLAWRAWYFNVTGSGEPEQVIGAHTSGNFFRMLGLPPLMGRDFSPEDEEPGHEQVVIISNGLWQRRYGSDPGILARAISGG